MALGVAVMATSCGDDNKIEETTTPTGYEVAERALIANYPDATNISWSTQSDYQVAKFKSSVTKSDDTNYTVWYEVDGDDANEVKSNQNLNGELSKLPTSVQNSFDETVYADATLWTIEEIEKDIDSRDDDDNTEKVVIYEIELDGIAANEGMEAELKFDADGKLIFKKEELDDDNDDDDNDKLVINQAMQESVEEFMIKMEFTDDKSDILIIDAELDDNKIEVDVVIISKDDSELELELNATTYEVIGYEYETEMETTYREMPSELKNTIIAYYETYHADLELPNDEAEVKLKGEASNDEEIKVEVDIEYTINGVEYEASFELIQRNGVYSVIEGEIEVED